MWNLKRPPTSQRSPKKKQSQRHHTSDFKLYCKAIVIKPVWCHKNTQIHLWKRFKSPDINSQIFSQPIFDKGIENTHSENDSPFNKC